MADGSQLSDASLLLLSAHGLVLFGLCRSLGGRLFGTGPGRLWWGLGISGKTWQNLLAKIPQFEQGIIAKLVNVQLELTIIVLLLRSN